MNKEKLEEIKKSLVEFVEGEEISLTICLPVIMCFLLKQHKEELLKTDPELYYSVKSKIKKIIKEM